MTGEVAEEEGVHHHDGEDGPEGNLGEDVLDADAREGDELLEGGGEVEDLVNDGEAFGDEGAGGFDVGGIVFAFAGGAAALRDGGEGFDREREEGVDDDEAEDADADPDEAVVEEDAGQVELQGVLLDGSPVAGDGVEQADADGIEDGGPEVLEGTRGGEDDVEDEVDDEERDALKVDDEELAGESGDGEEDRAEEEDLHDGDEEEGVQVPVEGAVARCGRGRPRGRAFRRLRRGPGRRRCRRW